MVPSRTARRIVSSHLPVSDAASAASSSVSKYTCAAAISLRSSATRAAAACSAPFSRSVSDSRCASRTKAASQGGVPSGRSRTGRKSAMLHAVLLPDAFAGLGRHRPVLLVEAERHLLQVRFLAALSIPVAEQFRAVLASAEALADQLDLAHLRRDATDVRPLI